MLTEKVKKYYELDAQIKKLDAEKKLLNAELKDYMRSIGEKSTEIGGYKVVFSIQERVSMNEPKLVQRLKTLGKPEAIKLVEVPDQAVLEEMIYTGNLAASEIADCMDKKEVETLTVKGSK